MPQKTAARKSWLIEAQHQQEYVNLRYQLIRSLLNGRKHYVRKCDNEEGFSY